MFEAHVLHLLRLYLGEYVRGLSVEALKISVWQGDVVLKDLQLKAEALNALKLPITVKAGFLGSVTLKVPWNRLGKDPVIVLLDRIFILAEPLQDDRTFTKEDKDKWYEAKRRKCEEAELAMLEAKDHKTAGPQEADTTSNSWFSSLIATIVGNLKISITNLHIRYEDTVSNPGHPFCSGVTLATLAAVTIDERGHETFVTSGALERLRKSLRLERLAVYHDPDSSPWDLDKAWEHMAPEEWEEVFMEGILRDGSPDKPLSKWATGRQYLLHPVGGLMTYNRRGKREKREPEVPFQDATLVLEPVSLTVSEAQYCDGMKLLEGVSTYRNRLQYSHFRPQASVSEDTRAWWLYGCQAVLQQNSRVWYRLQWSNIADSCRKRRKYVQLYASCLHQSFKVDNQEIKDMEKSLDIEVILLWRLLAHARVESVKSKEAAVERERIRKSSWWSFGWGTVNSSEAGTSLPSPNNSPPQSTTPTPPKGADAPGQLTKEEWSKINQLLSYQPGEDVFNVSKTEASNMMQMALDVSIQQGSARVLDGERTEILCATFENLQVGIRVFPKTLACEGRLRFYGLSAPEGMLIESVSREGRDHALSATYVQSPYDENLDWMLSATMSPCHVKVWRISFERFLQFLKSSQALSPGIALETAAVLQNKLEEVRRRAQEQLQQALEQQSRFSIDLDLDAPKISIPAKVYKSDEDDTQLLLDLGHFTLHTATDGGRDADNTKADLYSRFSITGKEISAFVVDRDFDWSEIASLSSGLLRSGGAYQETVTEKLRSGGVVLPVLDPCGMTLVLDQIRVQHPNYPSTRLAIKVPRLGIHFSPARYHRLMSVLSAIGGADNLPDGSSEIEIAVPWQRSDFSGDARILAWGGIGSTVAEWQPCRAVLAGTYLYILESENAHNYQRCISVTGKQVVEVPCANIGNFENVIAICHRGVEIQKVVESSSALILQLKTEDLKAAWQYYMALATYKAPAPLLSMLSESSDDDDDEMSKVKEELHPIEPAKQPQLFVMGFLQELRIFLSNTAHVGGALGDEKLILELQAHGGKVDVLQRQYDMSITMKVHSLRIEDKLQGHVAPSCRYLLRSSLSADAEVDDLEISHAEELSSQFIEVEEEDEDEEEEEVFDDALAEFGVPGSPSSSEHGSFHRLFSSGRSDLTPSQEKSLRHWEVELMNLVREGSVQDMWVDAVDEEVSDFANMRLIIRQTDSPDYDDTDVQMAIRMSTLDFFCNRPTVVALIEFGSQISDSPEKPSIPAKNVEENDSKGSTEAAAPRDVVKGLLGRGKSRVVFRLKLDMESARISVNKEGGSILGMLIQDKFRFELKVYPGSLTISGTLGNLRVCDMFLGADHQWGWLCDIRDPGAGSLVELEFQSYNKDEDDYKGYDYSLSGKLSAVRIVFLYRFIQEITAYFVALATPQTTQVVTVVDKVGGTEKLIQQSDVDGSPAVKLDFSLDTPTIIMPRCSHSQEFMQLDLGHLEVHNSFEWHGGDKGVASAVHLDVLHAEMTGINMVVGINGQPGKPMLHETRGLQLKVQRPLRDLFKKVPELAIDVQVPLLSGVMTHKEYLVIIDCASTNLSEAPSLPPTFREPAKMSEISDAEKMLLETPGEFEDDKTTVSTRSIDPVSAAGAYTKMRVTVDVRQVELDLYIGLESETPLARLEIQKFWLSYCSSSTNNMDVLITLSKLSVLDQRFDTRPEMRLMLGSMADVEKLGGPSGLVRENLDNSTDSSPQLTMLVLDLRFKTESQAIVIRLQRPRLLVVVDFLLGIGQFFVPSLGNAALESDPENPQNDAEVVDEHIRLSTSLFQQKDETIVLSCERQLIVEAYDVDEFIYDGCGKTLILDVKDDEIGPTSWEPLIVIGCEKKLQFKNVRIENGFWLSDCVHLNTNSSYTASLDDGVILEGMGVDSSGGISIQAAPHKASLLSPSGSPVKKSSDAQKATVSNYVVDIQAVAPELTFYDSTKWPAGGPRRERVLRANLDCYVMIASKGNDKWIKGMVKGLTVEGGSGLVVVDPLDVSAEYACVQEKITLTAGASDISTRLSFNVLSLILRFQDDAFSTFKFGVAPALSRCTHFDRIWVNVSGDNTTQQVAIWRPRAPSGYLIMSDCATSGVAPPSQAVMAISNTCKFAQKPIGFDLLWSTRGASKPGGGADSNADDVDSEHCCVWMPVAPLGYVALGCVAERGVLPPSLSSIRCIRSDLVTSGSLSDCIYYCPPDDRGKHENGCSIWRIENAAGSFYAHSATTPPSRSLTRDLSETLLRTVSHIVMDMDRPELKVDVGPNQASLRRLPSVNSRIDSMASGRHSTGRYLITTPRFERLWWDKGSEFRSAASIWRPVVPAGYAFVGDCLVQGLEPPGVGVALRDGNTGRLAKPLRYLQRMHTTGRGLEDVVVWFPVAPAGYVAVGCIVTKTQEMPSVDLVRCLRVDLVIQSRLSKPAVWALSSERSPNSVWSMSGARGGYSCSMWRVENQANTFFARPDLKCPPGRMAYALADGKKKAQDKLSADIKIGRISATIFDDMGGLMTPLVNTTITNINLAAHGRLEAMSAVIITNMAASTFNTQLECWEPFIEPFEGIFKYESFDVDSEAPFKVGKRIRITAANAVNLNVTSAGLETLVESVMSWRKQTELEEQARMSLEMEGIDYKEPSLDSLNCALEEDELEKLLVQNKLGCDLYMRKFVDNFEQVECFPMDGSSLVHLPPVRFPDRFIDVNDSRPPRHFVAIHVSQAKELLVNADGNDQDYMCALKLAITRSTDEQKTLPQSARSRCVRPSAITQGLECLLAEAKWNEVFIFELPEKGSAALEVLISNQAARGGKGEAVGLASIPIDGNTEGDAPQSSLLWNVVRRALKQGPVTSWPAVENKIYPLSQPRKMNVPGGHEAHKKSWGLVTMSMYFFSAKGEKKEKMTGFESKDDIKGADIGLWLALTPQGPWTGLRSVLPATTIPKEISRRPLAIEVSMQQNQKCVKVRGLVMVVNNTDMALDVCLCPFPLLNIPDGSTKNSESNVSTIMEEIFENQRYQPFAGWGSKWPGHMMPGDPSRWSNRDYSNTSQELIEPSLPPGWVWSTNWSIDRNGYVDDDGWFYGADFQSLKIPPTSSKAKKKSMFDFARRRRLIRQRKCIPETHHLHSRQTVGVVQPGDSVPLPWAGSDSKTDMCVQVRPQSESSRYSWGRAISDLIAQSRTQNSSEGAPSVSTRQTKSNIPISALPLKELEKTEEILFSKVLEGSSGSGHGLCWLNMDVDATVLYNEMNNPLPDWRITVNAPVKLENRLPCSAAYIIWEKPRASGNLIKQQDGIVSAGGSVHIYSVDVRRTIYLTWLAQGGWRSEKEIIPISDPSMEDLPTGFWMAHQASGRRLRVSLEHDFGGSSASAKIVRLFVPYWLRNDASLPLAYRLVEIEPHSSSTGDTTWLTRAAKAAKQAARRPTHPGVKKTLQLNRVVNYLERVEDMTGTPVMLSLQAYSDRIGGLSLSSRSEDGLLSPRLGLAIAVTNSKVFSRALSFRDFESNMERVNLNAVDDGGGYYKLSAFLDMSSDRTKVIHVQPHTLFVNRLGRSLSLRQCDLKHEELFYPNDPPKAILWQSTDEQELLKINIDGYRWSQPFSVDTEGVFHVTLQAEEDDSCLVIRGEVRNGVKDSRYFVVFRLAARQSPYRVENRSTVMRISFRQAGSDDSSWKVLLPGSSASFAWEDLVRNHHLEILPEGFDPQHSIQFNIDEPFDYHPFPSFRGSAPVPLRASVISEGFSKVFKVADSSPSAGNMSLVIAGTPTTPRTPAPEFHNLENQFHTSIELAEFGLSIVDYTPEELLYVSIQNLVLSYATGLGSGTNRLKFRVDSLQIDNQLPLTPSPVLFMVQESQTQRDFLLKCTITMQENGMLDYFSYPYIGIQGPNAPNVSFLVNIHEPIIWRLHEMFQRLDLGRLSSSKTTAVAIDPIIRIGLLQTSEIRFKVTLAMAPAQRPRGMLGFWATLITSLGNTDEMPIRITPRVHEDVSMRQSALWAAAFASVRNDLLSQPFQLLSGVDILGNTSSALGNMSKGVAALSMDKKFIRGRQKQANVEDLGEGIREGGEAFAKSLFRGVTGIVTKPFEGAQKSGMEGFLQGVGKGVIGVGIQPLSGALDLLSKTTEGANAMRMKLSAAISFEQQALRRRLPRVIGGDNVLRPYDEYKARGQVLMQLAERGTIFGPVDFFRVRGKFAMSDAYEDHFNLPKGRTLMITHRRVILLQHPTSLIQQKKPDLLKEPCTVTWDVMWDDLKAMELFYAKDDSRQMPPFRLVIRVYANESRMFDNKETNFVVKCHPGTKQAGEIRNAVQQALNTYGPGRSSNSTQELVKKSSARKPYAGAGAGAASGAALGLLAGPAAPIAVPVMATFGALIGSASQAMLDTQHDSQVPSKTEELHDGQHAGTAKEAVHIGKLINDFKLLWWDKEAPWGENSGVSIWRPVPPSGYVSVGDVMLSSYDSPDLVMVYHDDHDGKFAPPEGFDLVWRDAEQSAKEPVTIWRPRAPQGYVALGCVIVPDYSEPVQGIVSCVRQDCVAQAPLQQAPISKHSTGSALWQCSLWRVQNNASTFLAQRDHRPPPPHLAYRVVH
ncbi:hypothetical protein KC19_7G189300 [Ceratodon purpureus]|uniref:Vacuolar protein sorting-associated protein n=1 Tax=Ceratodon purpureus TaxID=3225 RepID=A0A8T0HBU1_CERPU|nr:hypothetical protein KC19_7G189300 [Ceratodon purpureus]